ncbi:MAG: hypothetical protein LBG57_03845 [Treponema sp.]|jgi:hypothetical protein|nr:hypothetical protein [Treponema sp.]
MNKKVVCKSSAFKHEVPDKAAADYILTRAEASRQTPAQMIGEMVRERIAAST